MFGGRQTWCVTDHSDEPVEDKGRCGVVSPVVEGWDRLVLPASVALLEVRPSAGVQGSDGLQINASWSAISLQPQ